MPITPASYDLAGGFAAVPPTGAIQGRPIPGNPQQIPIGPGQPPSRRFVRLQNGAQIAVVFDPHRYARFNGEQAFTLAANTSTAIVQEPNTFRNALVIRNGSSVADLTTNIVYVSFGGGGASLNSLLRLVPGDQIAFTDVVPQDIVYAFSPTAGAIVIVGFSNTPDLLE